MPHFRLVIRLFDSNNITELPPSPRHSSAPCVLDSGSICGPPKLLEDCRKLRSPDVKFLAQEFHPKCSARMNVLCTYSVLSIFFFLTTPIIMSEIFQYILSALKPLIFWRIIFLGLAFGANSAGSPEARAYAIALRPPSSPPF